MWVFLTSRGETSACTATRGADWTVWIGSWLGDETTRNQMMPHLNFKRFLKSNVTCDLDDRIMIFLYRAITLSLPLKRMLYCLKSSHSLRFYLVFPRVIACFALGLLQLLYCGHSSFHERNVLPGAMKLSCSHLALVHLSPPCPKYMCSQWPISMYCHNCICNSNGFSVASCKQNTLSQVPGWTPQTSGYCRNKFQLVCC